MSCVLNLLAQRQLRGLFPAGEISSEGKLSFRNEDFRCCQLSGLRFAANGNCRQCEIQDRIRRIERLLTHFKNTWPETPFPRAGVASNSDFILDWLFSYRDGTVASGYHIKRKGEGPSPFWWFAVASIWRFGMEPFVIKLNANQTVDALTRAYPRATERPSIVFLEQISDLRDKDVAFFFDAIVGWCDSACIPLWIETLPANERDLAPKPGQSQMQQAFNAKIATIRRKRSVLSWLPADTRSRLTHVCNIPQ